MRFLGVKSNTFLVPLSLNEIRQGSTLFHIYYLHETKCSIKQKNAADIKVATHKNINAFYAIGKY